MLFVSKFDAVLYTYRKMVNLSKNGLNVILQAFQSNLFFKMNIRMIVSCSFTPFRMLAMSYFFTHLSLRESSV